MRQTARFSPRLESLETIQLLSAFHGHGHGHAQVHRNEVKPPHQGYRNMHTGIMLAGLVECQQNQPVVQGIEYTSGRGRLRIGGINYDAGFSFGGGVFSVCADHDFIYGTIVTLEDGSAGNYKITEGTGQFKDAKGTGVFFVNAHDDGSVFIAINPHQ